MALWSACALASEDHAVSLDEGMIDRRIDHQKGENGMLTPHPRQQHEEADHDGDNGGEEGEVLRDPGILLPDGLGGVADQRRVASHCGAGADDKHDDVGGRPRPDEGPSTMRYIRMSRGVQRG